jgi:hypothetical protein
MFSKNEARWRSQQRAEVMPLPVAAILWRIVGLGCGATAFVIKIEPAIWIQMAFSMLQRY